LSELIDQGTNLWCLSRRTLLMLSINGTLLLLRVSRTAAVVCLGSIVGGRLLLTRKLLISSEARREQLPLSLGLLLLWGTYAIARLETCSSIS
jgi:hypothetical protein